MKQITHLWCNRYLNVFFLCVPDVKHDGDDDDASGFCCFKILLLSLLLVRALLSLFRFRLPGSSLSGASVQHKSTTSFCMQFRILIVANSCLGFFPNLLLDFVVAFTPYQLWESYMLIPKKDEESLPLICVIHTHGCRLWHIVRIVDSLPAWLINIHGTQWR